MLQTPPTTHTRPAMVKILTGGKDQAGETAAQRGAVYEAAAANGLNADVLWAIYGAESTWGRGGGNWFGLTSVPRTSSFAGDANAAAATLRHLLDAHGGDYEAALRAYSGGSYGTAHLADVLKADPTKVAFPKTGGRYDTQVWSGSTFNPSVPEQVGQTVSGAAHAVSSVGDTLSSAWSTLTSAHTWIRVVEIIGGVALLLMGLKSLTGGAVDPVGAVRKVVR